MLVRGARYPGILALAASLFVLGSMRAHGEETASDRLHICISRALPEKVVTIGFTPTIYVNLPRYRTDKSWFPQLRDLFWRIRFPAESWVRQAPDRPEITTQIYRMILYPQMVWAAPVNAELRRMLKTSAAAQSPPQGDCLQYADLSPEEIAKGQILIEVTSPIFGPPWNPPRSGDCEDETPVRRATRTPELDFDSFKACRYEEELSFGMVHRVEIRYFGPDTTYPSLSCPVQRDPVVCRMGLNRDGWPFSLLVTKELIREWRAIADAATSFLDKATVSRDDITVARIDRRP